MDDRTSTDIDETREQLATIMEGGNVEALEQLLETMPPNDLAFALSRLSRKTSPGS